MSEPQLQRPCVVAVVRQLEAAGMPEHVRVNGEGQGGFNARPSDRLAHTVGAHWTTTLRDEHESAMLGPLPRELPERAQLRPPDWVSEWRRRRCSGDGHTVGLP